MSVLEAGMIICFGVSWRVAILKTLKTKSVQGKSRMFLVLVLAGYGLGILHKIFFNLDVVLACYVFNFSMVFIEICLWFRYHGRPLSIAGAEARRSEGYAAADTLLADPVDLGVLPVAGAATLSCPPTTNAMGDTAVA